MLWLMLMIGCAFFSSLGHMTNKDVLKRSNLNATLAIVTFSAALFLSPLIFFINPINLHQFSLLISASAFGMLGGLLLNSAYQNCEISTVAPLLSINPVFIALLSWIILGEKLMPVQLFGIFLVIIGGYLISVDGLGNILKPLSAMPKKYFLYVFGTLVLWAFAPVLSRIVILQAGVLTTLFYFIVFIFVFQFLLALKVVGIKEIIMTFRKEHKKAFSSGSFWIISDLLGNLAMSIPTAMVSILMPIKRVSSLFIVILGGNFFMEKHIYYKVFASIIMLAGVFMLGYFSVI